jgi:hypothetical protein
VKQLILIALTLASIVPRFELAAQTAIIPGETLRFSLDAGTFTNDLAIDVPADMQWMRVDLDGPDDTDIDLALRYGEPFPVNGNAGVFGGVNWLFEHAHYFSISSGSDEWIIVNARQQQPLRAGRWYLSVINFGNQPAPAQIDVRVTLEATPPASSAPVEVVFDDTPACAAHEAETAPWFDDAPVAAIGGNSGTTRGEQRRNAFNHAISQLSLDTTSPIRVLACWKDLGGDAGSATLASAGPTYINRDDGLNSSRSSNQPFLPKAYTWYSAAGTAQLAGNDACRHNGGSCARYDIFIQFNTAVDGDVVLGNHSFHYGFTPPATGSGSEIDFVTTAMHEITHGLGFTSLINLDADNGPIGEKFKACYTNGYCEPVGHDDIYTDSVARTSGANADPINQLSLEERAAALTSGLSLRWAGEEAVASTLNPMRAQPFPQNLPPLYAPAGISSGSTLSHLHDSFSSQLMTPFINNGVRSLGLARPMLSAVGWPQAAAAVPAFVRPYGGQWFNPARNGHGIDLHRVADLPDTYMLVFYTFDAQGLPEWYLSIGRIVEGVFLPGNDGNGNSLWRSRYLFGPPPGQTTDTSVPGQIRIDFNQAERAPACNDGIGRNTPLALMTFTLGNDDEQKWCMTQIVPEDARPDFDRTGHWYAGEADAGWGVTSLSYGDDGLFMIIYYPDSQGRPRWAGFQADPFESGVARPLLQVQGYCRTCPSPSGPNAVSQIGTVTLSLDEPEGSQGQIRFEVDFDGPGGGHFERDPAPLIRLAESAPGD